MLQSPSLDIDVLDPAYAPGTGIPEPNGLSRPVSCFLSSDVWGLRLEGSQIIAHYSLVSSRP